MAPSPCAEGTDVPPLPPLGSLVDRYDSESCHVPVLCFNFNTVVVLLRLRLVFKLMPPLLVGENKLGAGKVLRASVGVGRILDVREGAVKAEHFVLCLSGNMRSRTSYAVDLSMHAFVQPGISNSYRKTVVNYQTVPGCVAV
jgi:hypothetical protein